MSRWEPAIEVETGFEAKCLVCLQFVTAYTRDRLKKRKEDHKTKCKRRKRDR